MKGMKFLNSYKNIHDEKNQKPIVVDVLFKAYQWYHSHADQIWPDRTYKDFFYLHQNGMQAILRYCTVILSTIDDAGSCVY
jgi:hypothetical protein